MKKILLSSVALLGLTAGAMAADLPSRRVAPAPYVAVPVFTWTGFYVGVNAGYGFNTRTRNGTDTVFVPTGTFAAPFFNTTGNIVTTNNSRSNGGFVGGGQIGYNYQIGTFVIGVEADIQYADLRNNRNGSTVFVQTGGPTIGNNFVASAFNNNGIDWFGTVRARAGFAFDRALLYATGGFAYGGGNNNSNVGIVNNGSRDNVRGGYTVGGGVEYAFTPNLSAKLEGLYVNLDRKSGNNGFIGTTINGTPVYLTGLNNKFNNDIGVVRVGLNYKFNGY